MPKEDVDRDKLRISTPPPPDSSLIKLDDVFIVVTQAFCHKGHSLMSEDNDLFDGYPGIKVRVRSGNREGDVVLSPFHGDASKKGDLDWKDGTKLEILCPVCRESLVKMASCRCAGDGDLIKIYLSPNLSDSHILAMCNIWGCHRSRTIDNWQIISEYFDGQIDD